MYLNIPAPQGSLRPFFAEVRRYLLDEMKNVNRAKENREFRDHINRVRNFVNSINPDDITIDALLYGLSQAGQFDSENIAIYRDDILEGLRRYLIQVREDGWNALMLAARNHPEVVQLLLEALPEASKQRVFEQVTKEGCNALMIAAFCHAEVIQSLLEAMPEASKQRVSEQVNQYGYNALMIAAHFLSEAVQPLLAGMPESSRLRVFEQVREDGWNALMLSARNSPEVVQSLLEATPKVSMQRVFEQVTKEGWNALMLAARSHPEAVQSLLAAMPEASKQRVFEQVTEEEGYNALMIAADNSPEVVQSLLDVMPEASKQRVFKQVSQNGNNALMIAARCHPEVVQPLLAAMPRSSRQLTFQYEDNQRFTYGSKIIQSLFAGGHIHSVLTLLQESVLQFRGKAFKEIVAHKQQLLDCILKMEERERYQLLEDIHDNTQDSQLARVFHTSRGILKPQRNRGILGQAENEYLRLYQERNDTENQKLKPSAPLYEDLSATASGAQDSADNHDTPSLYPFRAQSFEFDYCKPAYKMYSLTPLSISPYTAVPVSDRQEGISQLIDLSDILTGSVENKRESKPIFFSTTPLTPISFFVQNRAGSSASPQENNQALSEREFGIF